MNHTSRRPSSGFTLIELLTVVAIIGILAAIIIPTIGSVRISVQRSVEGTNLHSICQAAIAYASDSSSGGLPDPLSNSGNSMQGGSKFYVWMGLLAKTGALADPSLYFSKIDKFFANADLPAAVVNPDQKTQLDSKFVSAVPAYEFVGGTRLTDPGTTPLGFTRGLKKDGSWEKNKGPYEDWGGFVGFLGGNVTTFKGNIEAKLVNTKQRATDNIAECIPLPTGGNQRIYGKGGVIGSEGGTSPDQAK